MGTRAGSGGATTWVAVSADQARDYSFSLPLAALFWRHVVGFRPLCMIVGDWSGQERSRIALEAVRHLGFDVCDVSTTHDYSSANVAQNAREHAAAVPAIRDEDWVLPSDADLWPLKAEFYLRHESSGRRVVCYYSNGDHFVSRQDVLSKCAQGARFQTIPTCHVTMRARDWRAAYGLRPGEDVGQAVKRTMDSWIPPRIRGKRPDEAAFISWMSDQDIVTWQLCRQDWFDDVLMVPRWGHPPVDRLDRGAWPRDGMDLGAYVDVHIPRAPDSPDSWEKLRPIIERFLPRHLAWADDYRERHWRSYNP